MKFDPVKPWVVQGNTPLEGWSLHSVAWSGSLRRLKSWQCERVYRLAAIKGSRNVQFYTAQYHRCHRFRGSVQLVKPMSTRAVAHEINVYFPTISGFQGPFREFCNASNQPTRQRQNHWTWVAIQAQNVHIQHIPWSSETSHPNSSGNIGFHNQRISLPTVRNRLREAHLHARHPHLSPVGWHQH